MKTTPTPIHRRLGQRLTSLARALPVVLALVAFALPIPSFAQAPTFNTLVTTYQNGASYAAPNSAAVADFNGDGKLDAIVTDGGGILHIMLGNGNGSFSVQNYDASAMTPANVVELPAQFNTSLPHAVDGYGGIKAADLNGDGKPDLVVLMGVHLNFAPLDFVSVMINTGNDANGVPQFAITHYYGYFQSFRSLTVGDLTGDGRPDFIVGNAGGVVSVYKNSGNGTFTRDPNYFFIQPSNGGPSVGPGLIADFNGDGKTDFLVTSNQAGATDIFWGNGNGTFQATPYIIPSFGLFPVATDFNGDGKLDFMTVDFHTGNMERYLNNGNGTFSSATVTASGLINPYSLALADINGDGKLDAVMSDFGSGTGTNGIAIKLGDGTGTFGTPFYFKTNQRPLNLIVADYNGDGKPDVSTLSPNQYNPDSFAVLTNTTVPPPPPTFNAIVQTPVDVSSGFPDSATVGDINGDGSSDVVIPGNNGLRMLLGNGTGSFVDRLLTLPAVSLSNVVNLPANLVSPVTTSPRVVGGTGDLKAVDMNRDGRLDLVCVTVVGINFVNYSFVSVLLNTGVNDVNGVPQFTTTHHWIPFLGVRPVTVGDLNGDNWPDFIIGTSVGNLQIWTSNGGTGTFTPGQVTNIIPIAGGPSTGPGVIVDVNGDGKADFVTVSAQAGATDIFFGNGDGTLQAPSGLLPNNAVLPGLPVAAAVADVNGDGRPDLLISNLSAGSVGLLVYLNNGGGVFSAPTLFAIPGMAGGGGFGGNFSVAVADLNGDGKLDAVMSVYNNNVSPGVNNVAVLPGNGSGGFGAPINFLAQFVPTLVFTADFTNDGKTDIGVVVRNSRSFGVLKNTTASSVAAPVVTSATASGTYNSSFSYQIAATNSPTSYAATGLPSGLSLNPTSGSISGTPTQSGTFTISLSATNSGGIGTGTLTITVNKAVATIALGGLSQIYDGAEKSATATTTPSGLTVTFNYVGSRINAGSYNFAATITDANYAGNTVGTLVIGKAAATVTLTPASLSQTYDGTPRSATVTTSPAGVATSVTYNGASSAPTAAGNYTVVATITDPNYSGAPASDTLAVGKATATIALGSLNPTYDGTVRSASATTSPSGLPVAFTYVGGRINAGSYDVSASIADNNYTGSASGTLIIGKAAPTVVVNPYSVTYDGLPHSATVASITGVNGETGATVGAVTLNTTHTNAGTYATDSWTFTGAANYLDLSATPITNTIGKANATVVVTPYSVTYDGNAHAATVASITGVNGETGATVGTADLSGTTHTNAGTYATDSWSFTGAANYHDIAATTIANAIAKANATVVVTPYNVTYNGQPRSATASITGVNGETGATVGTANLSGTTHTNAGTYATDSWSFTGAANYNEIAATPIANAISKANATVVVTPYSVAYNGLPRSATVSITGVNGETGATVGAADLSGTTHTNAGTYATDSWSFTGAANYNDIAATPIANTINKANATVVVTPYNVTYNGQPRSATVTSLTGANGETGATVGVVSLNTTHTNAGTYATDSWSFTGTANYNDIAATTITNTINRANATVVVTPYNVIYNGQPRSATVTSITGVNGQTGATVGVVTLNTTHTNAGTYTDSWSFAGTANYNNITGSTITNTITKANATVSVRGYTVTYNGQPRTATVTRLTGVNGESGATVGTVNLSGTIHTNAGLYPTDTWTFSGPNYNSLSGTARSQIYKASANVAVAGYTVTYNGQPHTATVTRLTGVNGETGPIVGTVNLSRTTHTNAGTYTFDQWTFSSPNYNARSGTVRNVINKANATVTVTPYNVPYDGLPHTATASIAGVNGETGSRVGTVNLSRTTHTNLGTYATDTWSFTGTPNYNNIGSRQITNRITPGIAVVTFSPYAQTYDGTPKAAMATTTPAGLALRYTYPGGSLTPPAAVGTYAVTASVVDGNYTGSAPGTLVIVNGGPILNSVSPNSIVGGTAGTTITVAGSGFTSSSVVRFGSTALVTSYVNGTTLAAVVPASLVPSPANGIATVPVTVLNGTVISQPKPFTVRAASVSRINTTGAAPGQTASSATVPNTAGQAGLSATLTHSALAAQPATLTTATYSSNPTTGTRINTGGGLVDLQIAGADPADTATVRFYYSSTVTGGAEARLVLRYFNGTTWAPIKGSGGVNPTKSMNNNLDGTVSGGRFTVTFSNTSTPKITELSGTVIAMAINQGPAAAAGPNQTVDATIGNEAFVTLDGSGSTDPDDGDVLTYEWREGRKVLGTDAVLTTSLDVGAHTLTLEVTDESGETSTDTVVITVRDVTAPTLILPEDIVRSTKQSDGRKVRYDVDVLDLGSERRDLSVHFSHRSGSRFPIGTTTVTVTAKDEAGNISTGTFTITVNLRSDDDEDDGRDGRDDDDDDDRDHGWRHWDGRRD